MAGADELLKTLALVLCTAGLTTVLFQKLRQPVVLGYLLAGVIIGPHVPIPLFVHEPTVRMLSELGVILLMFGIGLEFRIAQLVQVAPTAGLIALVQSSLMVWLGYLTGRLLGWTELESLYAGAIIAISSTTIIAKAFEELKVKGVVNDIVMGVLIVEDLIAVLLLTMLTALSSHAGLSPGGLALTAGRLLAFIVALVVGGLVVVPRIVRMLVRLNRPETTTIVSLGICFGIAVLAYAFGYSVALGAFIAGSLVAESGEEKVIEHLVRPVRDVFSAIFFVSVGMLIDPAQVADHIFAVLLFTLLVIVGKVVSVTLGAFLTGYGPRTAVQAGMSLAQIGEFSFIIAALGPSTGATRPFLYPLAVAVSAITTLTTPWLIRASESAAAYVEDKLPKPVRSFVELYGSWLARLRGRHAKAGEDELHQRSRRLVRLLVLDALAIAVIVIGASLSAERAGDLLETYIGIPARFGGLSVIASASILTLPFLAGLLRTTRHLVDVLSSEAAPSNRALAVTLQAAIATAIVIPLIAITQPFLPSWEVAAVVAMAAVILALAFVRTARRPGVTAAGVEVVVDALAKQSRPQADAVTERATATLRRTLPWISAPNVVVLSNEHFGVGKSLRELNVRGCTGATVVAIAREDRVFVPPAEEALAGGDALALGGPRETIEAARTLLLKGK